MFTMIKRVIKNPKIIISHIMNIGLFKNFPDDKYLQIKFWLQTGRKMDIKNPKSFNEKLQWLKLYDRNTLYTKLVDKYEVRKYIASTIGEEYLIPLVGVWDKFDDIDFSVLPNQFVLKCNHDSGGIVICKNKSKFDIGAARKKINRSLKRNYYYSCREWPYKNIKPRIICEQYMVDESGVELKDYKIFCFSGEPKIIQVDYDRFVAHKRNIYDTEWNYLPVTINYPTDSNVKINKPNNLNIMLKLACDLAKNYLHVRIDFYLINDKIYFGEFTLYHGAGFEEFSPQSFDYLLGSWISLPIIS